MIDFIPELKTRNKTLYYFGWINILGAIACLILMQVDNTTVLGINAWIKPLKFFLSITIYSWTMGWFLHYLHEPKKVKYFNAMVLIVLIFEQAYVVFRAARGEKSHFNFSSTQAIILYSLMGVAITVLVVWTGYFAYLFFKRSFPQLPQSYVWGIRLGLLFFVIFSMGAHLMASSGGHTVGARDGGSGLPFVNWSRQYGDLRIAHFFGMHAMQLLPLYGYYISKTSRTTIIVSIIYCAMVSLVFIQALMGKPLLGL
ncbi:MAG TPA: hypothetical protein VF622_15180 [Segetibacter sp.]|jgi:hypothetical protein